MMEPIETNEEEALESPEEQLLESPDETHVPSRPVAASRTLNENEVVTHRVTPPFFRLVVWIIGVLIIAVLIILFARWIYHKSHHAAQTPNVTTQNRPVQSSNTNGQTGQTPQASNNSSVSNNTSNTSSQNSNLPNSGPGDTLAIFAGASLAAGGLHYAVTGRRAKQS